MKNKLLILLTLILITPLWINAEEFNFNWETDVIPAINRENESAVLGVLSDGSSIVMFNNGLEELLGSKNVDTKNSVLVKYDASGNIIWKKIAGKDMLSNFYDAVITENDEIITVGKATNSTEFIYEGKMTGAMIMKHDKDGNLIWQRGWGVDMQLTSFYQVNDSEFTKVLITNDDEYIAIGRNTCPFTAQNYIDNVDRTCSENQLIVKYDKDGNIIWQKSWSDKDLLGRMHKGKILSDGSFILAGELYEKEMSKKDIIIVKFDKDGKMLWQKNWGGDSYEIIENIVISDNGEIIMHVFTESTEIDGKPINYDHIILRLSKLGEVISCEEIPEFFSMTETENYYWLSVAEFEKNDDPMLHLYLKKYDKNWNLKQKLKLEEETGNIITLSVLYNLVPAKGDKVIGIGNKITTNMDNNEEIEYKETVIKFDSNMNILDEKNYDFVFETANINTKNILKNGNSLYTLCIIDDYLNEPYGNIYLKKYSIIYDVTLKETTNGKVEISKKISEGIIDAKPNEGFEVDKIIIKDTSGNEIKPVLQTNGTYSFELYDDVAVEVLFKESIENPKTGILDVMTILIIGFLMSITGFFIVKNYNERLEL